MKQILNGLDRLKSLKALTGIYGNIKDEIVRSIDQAGMRGNPNLNNPDY